MSLISASMTLSMDAAGSLQPLPCGWQSFLGNSADFWMNLQLRWNLYHARKDELKVLTTIKPYQSVAV
jgi:plasmid maintenance system antidote protein VapI